MVGIGVSDSEVKEAIRRMGYGIDHAHNYAIAISAPTGVVRSDGLPRMAGAGGIRSQKDYDKILAAFSTAKEAATAVIALSVGKTTMAQALELVPVASAPSAGLTVDEVRQIALSVVGETFMSLGIDADSIDLLAAARAAKKPTIRKKREKKDPPTKKKPVKKASPPEAPPAEDRPPNLSKEDLAEWGVAENKD